MPVSQNGEFAFEKNAVAEQSISFENFAIAGQSMGAFEKNATADQSVNLWLTTKRLTIYQSVHKLNSPNIPCMVLKTDQIFMDALRCIHNALICELQMVTA